VLTNNLHVKTANRSFYTKFQTTPEGTEGILLYELGNRQWNIPRLRRLLEKILPEKTTITDFEVTHNFPSLGERIMHLNATRIFRDNSEEQLILLAIEDITEKRKLEKGLEVFAAELEKQVRDRTFSLHEANADLLNSNENLEQFAYIASHDLQEPLRKIKTFASTLQTGITKIYRNPLKGCLQKLLFPLSVCRHSLKKYLIFPGSYMAMPLLRK
jgi:two-component system CheB/CheR fusion protein